MSSDCPSQLPYPGFVCFHIAGIKAHAPFGILSFSHNIFHHVPSQLCYTAGPYLAEMFCFFFFWPFRAALGAYGSSQARGQIGATAASLHHSHSNTGSKPHLRPTPQLTAMPDP